MCGSPLCGRAHSHYLFPCRNEKRTFCCTTHEKTPTLCRKFCCCQKRKETCSRQKTFHYTWIPSNTVGCLGSLRKRPEQLQEPNLVSTDHKRMRKARNVVTAYSRELHRDGGIAQTGILQCHCLIRQWLRRKPSENLKARPGHSRSDKVEDLLDRRIFIELCRLA